MTTLLARWRNTPARELADIAARMGVLRALGHDPRVAAPVARLDRALVVVDLAGRELLRIPCPQ